MNVFAYDYNGNKTDTGIDVNDVASIHVTVVTGDELLDITKKDGTVDFFDGCPDGRMCDFYDGHYVVNESDLAAWMDRKDSYDY